MIIDDRKRHVTMKPAVFVPGITYTDTAWYRATFMNMKCDNTLRSEQNGSYLSDDICECKTSTKSIVFCVYWNLFLVVQMATNKFWFRWWLGADRRQAITRTKWWPVHFRMYIYVSPTLSVLIIYFIFIFSIFQLISSLTNLQRHTRWWQHLMSFNTLGPEENDRHFAELYLLQRAPAW